MPRAEHDIIIDAPIDAVYGVIADYESYPEFLPEMKAVAVESRHEGVAVVRFEIELIMRISYTLRLVETPPHTIVWTLEAAKMMVANEGGWTLQPTSDGKTHATYGLEVRLRGLIPRSVSTRLMGETLPSTLDRFKMRAEGLLTGA